LERQLLLGVKHAEVELDKLGLLQLGRQKVVLQVGVVDALQLPSSLHHEDHASEEQALAH